MKKFLKIVFITLACLFLIVFIGGYVLIKNVDLNQYKGLIEERVLAATGRELKIGDIRVKPSIKPTIQVQDVEFANASWSKTPQMAKIGMVNVRVALVPLLHGQYVINRFIVSNAVVNLEKNANGEANWVFSPNVENENTQKENETSLNFSLIKQAHAEEMTNATVSNSADSDILSKIKIKEAAFENVKINYTDENGQKQNYDINLSVEEQDSEDIAFKLDLNKGLYRGEGVLGALNKLESDKGYPIKANLEIMGIGLVTDVTLFDVYGDLRFDGNVKATGFMGKDSTYKESADVTANGNLSRVDAVINSFKIAGNTIVGKVAVKLDEEKPDITANLKSDKINIAPFMGGKKTAWNLDFSLIKAAEATTMVPNDKIPYEFLDLVRADVDVKIAQISNAKVALAENLAANVKVNGGKAEFNIINGKISNGDVKANIIVDAQSQTVNLKTDMVKVNLIELLRSLDVQSDTFKFISGSEADLYMDLWGKGNTYASVAESLNGKMAFIVDKSELYLGNIGMMKGNIISQLINTLKLTKGNDDLKMKCAVVRADIKDGLANFPNGIVINANKFTVVADGDINLKNDKLNFGIKPFGGKLTDTNIAKALSSLVRLSGTLQNPKVGVDAKNVMKNVVGATMTGPVYLGAQMVMENDNSPCYTALKDTGYESRFPKSSNVAKNTSDDVGKVLDSSVGMVKDTAKGLFNVFSGKSENTQE